jgi:hypothetical protein
MIKKLDEKKDFLTFLEASFIALNMQDEASFVALMNACKVIDSDNKLVQVSEGYLHLLKMELDLASKSFEKILKQEPNHEIAKAFYAITQILSPKTQENGEKALKTLNAQTAHSDIKQLTFDALGYFQQEIKKKNALKRS